MRDPAAVASAMRGQRYLIHAAADYRLWAPDMEEIVRTNRDGTRLMMRAALEAGVERVVYTSSVATIKPPADGVTPSDETMPLTPGDRHRRLQAQQGRGRARGRRDGRPGRPAGGDRQPVDADRPPRRQADAHGADHPGGRARQDAGLRRYRPQPRPCRRRGPRPSPRPPQGPDRRALHPGRRGRVPVADARRHRRHGRPQGPDREPAARGGLPGGVPRAARRPGHRKAALRDDRRHPHVPLPDVLLGPQGARWNWATPRGPIARACPTRSRGSARRDISDEHPRHRDRGALRQGPPRRELSGRLAPDPSAPPRRDPGVLRFRPRRRRRGRPRGAVARAQARASRPARRFADRRRDPRIPRPSRSSGNSRRAGCRRATRWNSSTPSGWTRARTATPTGTS